MAGKGTYVAYASARPVGEQTTNNLRYAEQAGFQYRQEERINQDRKRDRLDQLSKQMGVDMSELQFNNTGVQSVDAPLYQYYTKTKGEVADLYKRIEDNPDDYDAKILLEKRMNSAKTLAGFTQRYSAWQQDYSKGLADGTYSQYLNGNLPQQINSGLRQGKYKIINDKNGDLQMLVDTDNDGQINDLAAVNIQEFLNGNELYSPKKAVGKYDAMDAIASRFGKVKTTEDAEGFKKTIYEGFNPEHIDDLNKEVGQLLGENKATMTDAAKSIIADEMGMNPSTMTDADFKEFRQEFSDSIINKFDKTESTTTDYGAINSANSLAYRRQRDAKKDAAQKEPAKTNDIEVVTGELGGTKAENGSTLFTLPENAEIVNPTGEISISDIEMRGEELIFKGTQTKGSGKDKETSKLNVTSDKDKNRLARKIPNPEKNKYKKKGDEVITFKDQTELYQYLIKKQETQGMPDFQD